jgi:hypothetical protein
MTGSATGSECTINQSMNFTFVAMRFTDKFMPAIINYHTASYE